MAGWFEDLIWSKTRNWIFQRLQPEQLPVAFQHEPFVVEPDKHYLDLRIRSLRLVYQRKIVHKFSGAVYSWVSLASYAAERGIATFQTVSVPENLRNADPKNIGYTIQANVPVLDCVPYRAGGIDLELGLFSIVSAELAGAYLGLLEKMASTAGVSCIGAALPFVGLIREGFGLLATGGQEQTLEVAVKTRIDPESDGNFKTGWYVLARSEAGAIDVSSLRLEPDTFRLALANGALVSDFPYLEAISKPELS